MADRLLAALAVAALLTLAYLTGRWISAYTDRRGRLGSDQASGPTKPTRALCIHGVSLLAKCGGCQDGLACGAGGPGGLCCDRPPHGGYRHEQDGIGWHGQDAPVRLPARLEFLDEPGGGD